MNFYNTEGEFNYRGYGDDGKTIIAAKELEYETLDIENDYSIDDASTGRSIRG